MLTRIALLVTLILPVKAIAQNTAGSFYDGNELYDRCETSQSLVTGYVAGVNDAFLGASAFEGAGILQICSPSAATLGQITDVVCKYLSDNPAERHLPAALLARKILRDTYPCSE